MARPAPFAEANQVLVELKLLVHPCGNKDTLERTPYSEMTREQNIIGARLGRFWPTRARRDLLKTSENME